MASLEQIRERVEDLSRRHREASTRKSKLQGRLDEKKKELARLKTEIETAGLDPKHLRQEKERLENELTALMDKFDSELQVVEAALDEYER